MPNNLEKELTKFIKKIFKYESIDYNHFHELLRFYSNVKRSEEFNNKEFDCLIKASLKYPVQKNSDWANKINWHDPATKILGTITSVLAGFYTAMICLSGNFITSTIIGYCSGKLFSLFADISEPPSNASFQNEVCKCLNGVDTTTFFSDHQEL